jgi:antitoxin StbD
VEKVRSSEPTMLKILDVPTSNISELKKDPNNLFEKAKKAKTGVYIFNRNTPAGIVMSIPDYEHMVREIEALQEKLFDAEAAARLKSNSKVYTDKEVRGAAAHDDTPLDEDDGWE